jgi:aryl-alcohol dehydrogenase-like predicted oxidoreductase
MSGANLAPPKTRKLGRTNVRVTELGLGTAPLGELFDKVEDDEATAIIGAAWDGGVRYFDTSPWYGRGLAEHSLGRALYRKPRDHYVIDQNWPRPPPPARPRRHKGSVARRPRVSDCLRLRLRRCDALL